ncbi:MAG: tetraacyldisaccharide 4'-kinase [Runella sp.]
MFRNLSTGIRWLLWPFAWLYGLGVGVRNWLFDKDLSASQKSPIDTINVGNLTIGGTGKTPHIEYLIRLLSNRFSVAVLSRGYGRATRGFVKADSGANAQILGDEPLQLYRKFEGKIPVYVAEKRVEGLHKIKENDKNVQIVLLDDAFQHRLLKPDVNILLTDYGRLFFKDFLLPVGLLREHRRGARRADAVVVTKCPKPISEKEKQNIQSHIWRYTLRQVPVFFSTFRYGSPTAYFGGLPVLKTKSTCWLVSGIAQPKHFEAAAKAHYQVAGHLIFKDHHVFGEKDIEQLVEKTQGFPILTTEKDFVKLKPLLHTLQNMTLPIYYWPVEVVFDDTGFDDFVVSKVTAQKLNM